MIVQGNNPSYNQSKASSLYISTLVKEKNLNLPLKIQDEIIIISLLWKAWSLIWRILMSSMHFFKLTPFGKGYGPSFEQNWIPCLTKGCFLPNKVKIGTMVLMMKTLLIGKILVRFWNTKPEKNNTKIGPYLTLNNKYILLLRNIYIQKCLTLT